MAKTYKLKYDGYTVGGDRLLDQVFFAVSIQIHEKSATILDIQPWSEHDASYLKQINVEHFKPLIKKDIEHNIEYLENLAIENGETFQQMMQEFEEECDEPGIQFLLEV